MALGVAFLLALTLIVIGALLAFTDILLFESLGAIMVFAGWALLAMGIIILIALLARRFLLDRDDARGNRLT